MKNILITKLEQQHIKDAAKLIQPLHESIVEKRSDIYLSIEQDWEEYLEERLEDNDWIVLVALVDGRVIGVCTAEIKHCGDNKETRIRDILFIDYIAIDSKFTRRGIGTKLLDEMKKMAMNRKVQTVELNVWGFNTSAIEFYEYNDMKPKRIIYEYLIDKEKQL